MSFIAIRTAFVKDRKDYSSPVFDNFSDFRREISLRLAQNNPLSSGLDSAGYADGYGATSQEVLTHAFLAAYSGKTPGASKLKSMPNLPQINWRITYDGLSKLKFAQKLFRSVNLTHAYRSTYGIASFNTSLLYSEDGAARDLGNNFIPKEEYGQINITEQFSPLIGIDVNFKNNKLTSRFEYKRDRNISLSFTDIQVTEIKGQEFVLGLGYRFRNFRLPFGLQGAPKKKGAVAGTGNDLNLTGDFSLRKNSTIVRRLQQEIDQPTAGLTILSFKLAADYAVNERFNVRLFFDKTINTPLISTSFPTANTAAGVSIRFTLAQ
jgi:cell surface protein SprA